MSIFRNGLAALTGKSHGFTPILESRFEKLAEDARKATKRKVRLH